MPKVDRRLPPPTPCPRSPDGAAPDWRSFSPIYAWWGKGYADCADPLSKGPVKHHPPVKLADRSMGPMDSQKAAPRAWGAETPPHQQSWQGLNTAEGLTARGANSVCTLARCAENLADVGKGCEKTPHPHQRARGRWQAVIAKGRQIVPTLQKFCRVGLCLHAPHF